MINVKFIYIYIINVLMFTVLKPFNNTHYIQLLLYIIIIIKNIYVHTYINN